MRSYFAQRNKDYNTSTSSSSGGKSGTGGAVRRTLSSRVGEAVKALALCHNVTPVYEEQEGGVEGAVTYQAASPDEVRI